MIATVTLAMLKPRTTMRNSARTKLGNDRSRSAARIKTASTHLPKWADSSPAAVPMIGRQAHAGGADQNGYARPVEDTRVGHLDRTNQCRTGAFQFGGDNKARKSMSVGE